MHHALPYTTWQAIPTEFPRPAPLSGLTSSSDTLVRKEQDNMKGIVHENPVVVIAKRGCCMSHVAKLLLLGLGVNPAIYEVNEKGEQAIIDELEKIGNSGGGNNSGMSFPTVFIGGRWFGDLERLMATHITGELTPILREAGALWL